MGLIKKRKEKGSITEDNKDENLKEITITYVQFFVKHMMLLIFSIENETKISKMSLCVKHRKSRIKGR